MQENQNTPNHIAIISDGNRRWAKARGLAGKEGHKKGLEVIEELVKESVNLGVKFFTAFVFSTENWSRAEDEVNYLMDLFDAYLISKKVEQYAQMGYKVRILGSRDGLRPSILRGIERVENLTKDNDLITVSFMMNYGGRMDIVRATKTLCQEVLDGKTSIEQINEDAFANHLYTCGIPNPDLLIRTGYERRISNFLLWQLAYAELFFYDKLLPDFNTDDLKEVVTQFGHRTRRFGR